MQQPGARIVFLERDGEIAVSGEGGDISTRRVSEIPVCHIIKGECAHYLGEDVEIVPVKMNGVEKSYLALVLDYVDGPLGTS
jgi:hypothetical protein